MTEFRMHGNNAPVNHGAARAEAKKLVESICEDLGNVHNETWEELGAYSPSLRSRLQFAFVRKDKMLAHSITT